MSKLVIFREKELTVDKNEIRNLTMVFNNKDIFNKVLISQLMISINMLKNFHLKPSYKISKLFSEWFYNKDSKKTKVGIWYKKYLLNMENYCPDSSCRKTPEKFLISISYNGRHPKFGCPVEEVRKYWNNKR